MGIIQTIETDAFTLNQLDDKMDHYTADCKLCGTPSWVTGKRVEQENGTVLYVMSLLCPSCRVKGNVSTLSDTNSAVELESNEEPLEPIE